jgi:hypothetical protein
VTLTTLPSSSSNMSTAPTAPLQQSHLQTTYPTDHEEWANQQSEEAFHKEQPDGWSPDHLGTAPTQYSHGSSAQKLSTHRTSHRVHGLRSKLGLQPLAPVNEEHDLAEHQDLLWSRIRLALREPFAEFMGVFILVLFGDGSVAQVLLSAGQVTAPGIFRTIYWLPSMQEELTTYRKGWLWQLSKHFLGMGIGNNAWHLCCRRLRSLSKPSNYLRKLLLPWLTVATVPDLLHCPILGRFRGCWCCLRQLR